MVRPFLEGIDLYNITLDFKVYVIICVTEALETFMHHEMNPGLACEVASLGSRASHLCLPVG